MSRRPQSELLAISTRRGLGFERFYRELNWSPHRAMGWYGGIGKDYILYLGYTLDHARDMLERLPVKKTNGKIARVLGAVIETPPPPVRQSILITTRRRGKR